MKHLPRVSLLVVVWALLPVFVSSGVVAIEEEVTGSVAEEQAASNETVSEEDGSAEAGEGADEADGEAEEGSESEAETDTETDVDSIFKVESAVGTQSVFNNRIPLYIYVKPKLDSSKAQITWDVPRGLKSLSTDEIWFEMEKDVGRTFTFYVEPELPGRYEVVVDITAWRYDTNYVSSAELTFEIDGNLHVTPPTSEYKRNQMLLTAGIAVGVFGLIVGGFFLVKFAYKKFKQWFESD